MKKDLIHSIYFSSDGYHDQLGNATVTLVNNPTVNSNGLNCNSTGYATLNSLDLGKNITIAVWFYIQAFNSSSDEQYQKVFHFSTGTGNNNDILLEQYKNENRMGFNRIYGTSNNNTYITSYTNSRLLKRWTLGIIRIEDKGNETDYSLYIRNDNGYYGYDTRTSNYTGIDITRNVNNIGASAAGTKIFNGYIKSINIWKRILSSDEIDNIYKRSYYNNIYSQTIPILIHI